MQKRFILVLVLMVGLTVVGCGGNDDVQVTPATATATAAATQTATASATALVPAAGTVTAANLPVLNGMRCVGQWRNLTLGSTGAFAARIEVGGGGGAITLDVGGSVFGAQGGTVEWPFRLVNNAFEIEAHTTLFGHISMRIGLDGKAMGTLQGVPALGPQSTVALTDYSLVNNQLKFGVDIDSGNGRVKAKSEVTAACSR